MIERDEELGQALRQLSVPEVSKPFWDQLHAACLADKVTPSWGRRPVRGIPRADRVFGAGWLFFGLGQLTTWIAWLPVWIGALAAGVGLLAGAVGLIAGALSGVRRGRLPLGIGAAALGIGRLLLAVNALASNDVVTTEVGRLVLGGGAIALGAGLVSLSLDWLTRRRSSSSTLAEASSVVGKIAGGISLASFGVALLTRGLGLAAYEAAWLAQWAGWHPPWTTRQLEQFFTSGLAPFAWVGAAAAVLGLAAFVLGIMTAGERHLRAARPAREVGGLVLALAWLGIEVKALLHGDWLPFGAGSFDLGTSALRTLNPVALVTGLGALGLGIGWFAVAHRANPRPPRQLRLQTCGLLLALPVIVAAAPPTGVFPAGSFGVFPAGSFMAGLVSKGTIHIGVKFDQPNLGYLNPGSHQLEGFDVAMGEIIADRLGVRPQFVQVNSGNRIPLLKEGKVDLVIATMTISESRAKEIDFSYPYLQAHQRLLVRMGSPVTGVDALNARRASVCSVEGSIPSNTIRQLAPDARLTLERDYSQCLEQLEQGKVDAITTDDTILEALRSRNPTFLQVVGEPLTIEPYGMGVAKGHPEFVDFVNETIREVKADGRWQRLYDHWIRPVMGAAHKPIPDGQRFELLVQPPPSRP
ncbi:MAG TPA: glutamate ABC transporter substrate-binding protein [Actinomycetota bacterium]|jgi:glutamate transport system substrate-binding protein